MPSLPVPDKALRIATWLVVALLSIGLYSYLDRAHTAISTSVELDYGEGTVYWQVQNLPHFEKAVHPLTVYPYILFNYTPVFHCATWLLSSFGLNLLAAGRLVSVLSMLGICVIAGLIVSKSTKSWAGLPCGLIAALLLLHLPNTDWSLLLRVDTIGIFFTYLGLSFFLLARKKPWTTYLAFACFTLALYCRQTLIAAPAACLVCLLIEGPRRALRVLLAFATTGLGILAVLAYFTQGELVRHLFAYNVSPLAWRHGLWLAYDLCRHSAVPILLAFACVYGIIGRTIVSRNRTHSLLESLRGALSTKDGTRAELVFTVYLAFCVLTSVSIIKVGANVNYLIELLFASCVLAAFFIEERLSANSGASSFAIPSQVLTLAMVAIFAVLTSRMQRQPTGPVAMAAMGESSHRQMLKRLESIQGDVYSEEMTVLLQAHKEVPGEPSSLTFLHAMRLWDEKPLLDRLNSHYFSALIVDTTLTNPEHFSPAVQTSVNANYELREHIGQYSLYLPRNVEYVATATTDSKEDHDKLATVGNPPR